MELNKNQKIILACTIVVIALMFLYPPFHAIDAKKVEYNLGYSFLMDAPRYTIGISSRISPLAKPRATKEGDKKSNQPISPEELRAYMEQVDWDMAARATVNTQLLLLQIFVTLLVGGGLLLFYKTGKQPSRPKGDANEAQKKGGERKVETEKAVTSKKNWFVGGLIVILPFVVAKPFLSDIASYNEPLMWFVIALLMCASYGLWYLWYHGRRR
ncbi:MAG: hypothetical protein ACLP2U_11810 [Syntrophobacteraceae bacterium]